MLNYNTVPLFPSPVIQVKVDDDTSELLEYDDRDTTVSYSTYVSTKQSGSNERVLEKYPKTKNILLDTFTSVAEEVLGYKKRKYAITTSWITKTKRGENSQLHCHKNSFWSAVYYFQEEYPEGSGGILFDNPNTSAFDFAFQNSDIETLNEINGLACTFKPDPNVMLVFPSYLKHQVLTHDLDTVRCSLALNIVPLGHWGEYDSAYDQAWVTQSIGAWR